MSLGDYQYATSPLFQYVSLEGGPTCVPVCERVAMTRLSRVSRVDWDESALGRRER